MNHVVVGESFQNSFWKTKCLSLDSETTGLMPFHGDKVFAIIISDGVDSWYFPSEGELHPDLIEIFKIPEREWFLTNAKFDLHHLKSSFGVTIKGEIFDTMTLGRLAYNDHLSYSLDSAAKRIGLTKSDAVEEYISEHSLWEWQTIPGKKVRRKNKFFQKVPEEVMVPYACQDALVTYKVANSLREDIAKLENLLPSVATVSSILETEKKLIKNVVEMEHFGVKVDLSYCEQALDYYSERKKENENLFGALTGKPYAASPKLFKEVFGGDIGSWQYTEKGNPSFESDILKNFSHPAAKAVCAIRNAKSRCDFFAGFIFHADAQGYLHPSFNPAGTVTGRFSSSDPNFQNLTNDEESEEAFPTRRAIIPPENYVLVSIDYDQQEYKLLVDYAGDLNLVDAIRSGLDVHEATAKLMGVSRKYAKTLNFMLLYGGGAGKLAKALGISERDAKQLKLKYFMVLPKIEALIKTIANAAKTRGYVFNWAGRRYFCNNSEFAYTMPNRIIQGGGADIMKRAINEIQEKVLKNTLSTIALTIHDELDFYIHAGDLWVIPKIKEIMENIYPAKYLPLTVSISHSWDSLGDLQDGTPTSQIPPQKVANDCFFQQKVWSYRGLGRYNADNEKT